jgi:predicted DNA-binding transcriptional regulator AlpA
MPTTNNTLNTLLTDYDVARVTGLSVATIRRRRLYKLPPKYLKISSAVRYRPEDITAWLDSCPTGGQNPAGGNND